MTLADATTAAVVPLDRIRASLLATTVRMGFGAMVWRREHRLALWVALGVMVTLGLTIVAPIALFVVGPVLLGVPHIASDVRYLILRRGLPRWGIVASALMCFVFIAMRVANDWFAWAASLRLELSLASAWICVAMIAGAFAGRSLLRLTFAVTLLGSVTLAALRSPVTARYILMHGHNLLAVAIWIAMFRGTEQRRHRRTAFASIVAITCVTCAVAFLLSGFTLRWTFVHAASRSFGLGLEQLPGWLSPSLSMELGLRLASAYVFLQAIHYSVWLGWIPQDDVVAEGTLTFRMSARSLFKDFGAIGLSIIVLTMLVVLIGALINVQRTRTMYVSLSLFHGYFELAMLGFFMVRGRTLKRGFDRVGA